MKGRYIVLAALAAAPAAYADETLPRLRWKRILLPKGRSHPLLKESEQSLILSVQGFYITGSVGESRFSVSSIQDTSQLLIGGVHLGANQPSVKADTRVYSAALGYTFPIEIPTDRIEIEYSRRSDVNYSPHPALKTDTQQLNSTLQDQALLGKIYHDFNFDFPLVPYISEERDFHKYRVERIGSGQGDLAGTSNTTRTNFAWAAGAGVRYLVTKNLIVGFGYQYASLGQAYWQLLPFVIAGLKQSLTTKNISENSGSFSLTWQM